MNCPSCKKEVGNSSKYCSNCGAALIKRKKEYSKILDKILNEDQSKKTYKPNFVLVKNGEQSFSALVIKTAKRETEKYMEDGKQGVQCPSQNVDQESNGVEKDAKGARLFGFIMLLTGLGASSGIVPKIGDLPLFGRIFFILFGLTFLLVPNKDLRDVKLFNRFCHKK